MRRQSVQPLDGGSRAGSGTTESYYDDWISTGPRGFAI
jgi:hypothetical protein